MADLTRFIEIIFGGRDEVSGVIKNIGKDLGGFGRNAEAIVAPLSNLTLGVIKTEAAIIGLALVAGAFAVGSAIKMQDSLLDLEKVLDPTTDDINKLKLVAFDLSETFGVASSSVLQSAADFKQAGFTTKDAFDLVEASLTATRISELEASEAATILIRLLKGFGLEASEVGRILDATNAITNKFATDFGKLAEAVARAAPIAKGAGLSFEELAALATPAIEVFQNGEIVGRALSTILNRLAGDNKKVAAGLELLGVAQKDANGVTRSARDIIFDLIPAYEKLDPAQRNFAVQQIAGIDQSAKLSAILQSGTKVFDILAVATDSAGSAQIEFDKRMSATGVQVERAVESFKNLVIALGEPLLEATSGVAKETGNLAQVIRTLAQEGGFSAFVQLAQDGFSRLESIIKNVAENLPDALDQVDFSGLIDSIRALVGEIDGIFDFDSSSSDSIASAIQTVIDVVTILTDFTRGAIESIGPFFRQFFDALPGLIETGKELAELAGNIGGMAVVATQVIGPLIIFSQTLLALSTLLGPGKLAGSIASLTTTLGPFVGNLLALAAAGAGGFAIGNLINEFLGLEDALSPLSKRLADFINGPSAELEASSLRSAKAIAARSVELRESTGVEEEFSTAVKDTSVNMEEYAALAEDLGGSLRVLKDGTIEVVNRTDDLTGAIKTLDDPLTNASAGLAAVGLNTELAARGFEVLADGTISNITPLRSLGDAATVSAEGLSKTAEETEKARKEAQAFELELLKLEQREREILFKIAGDIRVAEIQAQAAQVVAAFESIGQTVESTGDLLGSLADSFIDASSQAERSKIGPLLEAESKRRDAALELQRRLIDAQIDQINAQTDALDSGDAFITVEADGLEPELEAFMFKILERIQLKANAEGQQFLLGLN